LFGLDSHIFMLALVVASFVASLGLSLLLVLNGRARARLYAQDMPQRFHKGHVPRIGGVAIVAGGLLAWALAWTSSFLQLPINVPVVGRDIVLWSATLLPIVAAGIYEDFTQHLAVRWRLAAGALTAVVGCFAMNLSVQRLGLPLVDPWWQMLPWLGMALAFVAMAGLPHAFNIIDGYNGLAGIVAVLVCGAIAYVALQQGDRNLAGMLVAVMGATMGFLYWNYPRGLIFAGDGGAYLWGGVIAIACITLVQRHPAVSPWFAMLLLIYPVWETLFSMYRKWVRGVSPGVADSLHFHQLVYKRIVRGVFHDNETRRMLMRNNRTSPYLWAFTALTVVPAVLFWNNTLVLILFCGLFIVTYVVAYFMIVRFKVPRWLRR
jgi:UDP-GlcNAc:undecaprenyl-phosphate/decaprenyl-phosphate GlcNAc-1-phosphate transferase